MKSARVPTKPSSHRKEAGGLGWRDIGVVATLCAAIATFYGRVAGNEFVYLDDNAYVFTNPLVVHGLTRDGLISAFTEFHAANWHPLTWLSHMLDSQCFGVSPNAAGAHHLVSVGLHAANASVLYVALHLMTRSSWRSAYIAGLFAVHPLRVESVAWIAERKDVLSGLFFMLTLLAYARYARRPQAGAYCLVVLFTVLGLLSKPMLVTLPFVLLLLDVWPLRRWSLWSAPRRTRAVEVQASISQPASLQRLVVEKVPLLAAAAATGVVTVLAQKGGNAVADFPWSWRIVTAVLAYPTYLWKTLWPTGLAVHYIHPATLGSVSASSLAIPASLAFLLLVLVSVVVLRCAPRFPYLFSGWFWFLGTLVPVIGLLQVGGQFWADRYAYLPTIGIYIIVAWGVGDLVARRPSTRNPAAVIAVVALVVYGVMAHTQVGVWHDSRSLFEHALRVTRNNWMIESNLGAYLALSDPKSNEARQHLEASVRIKSDFADAHSNLAMVLSSQGAITEAREHWIRALALEPEYAPARIGLGSLWIRDGRFADARREFDAVLRRDPANAEAHAKLGIALAAIGVRDQARAHMDEALRLDPHSATALHALARWYATAPDAQTSDFARSVTLATQAAEESNFKQPEIMATIAAVLAAEGEFDQAIEWQRRALDVAGPGERDGYRARLERYVAREP